MRLSVIVLFGRALCSMAQNQSEKELVFLSRVSKCGMIHPKVDSLFVAGPNGITSIKSTPELFSLQLLPRRLAKGSAEMAQCFYVVDVYETIPLPALLFGLLSAVSMAFKNHVDEVLAEVNSA